jgi:hypothetical protein
MANSTYTSEWDIKDIPPISIDDLALDSTIDLSSIAGATGNYTIASSAGNAGGPSFYTNNTANNYVWANTTASPYVTIGSAGSMGQAGLKVTANAEFDGDIKWKGRSLGKMLETIEDRLAIIQDPDPKKLEKFAALKKAYDNYKLLEKLIGDDYDDKKDK